MGVSRMDKMVRSLREFLENHVENGINGFSVNAHPDFGCIRFTIQPNGRDETLDCLVFRNKVVPLFDSKVKNEKDKIKS